MTDFKELIDSIRKEQVTLFLGSGFSRKAGAPMADAISSALYEALPSETKKDFKELKALDIISEEYEQIFGRDTLITKLEQIMKFMPTDISDHSAITKVPHFHHIITTNYDTLIEDTYGAENCYVVRSTEDCVNLQKNKTVVYKIHGDFSAKDHILITKQDYTDFYVNNKEPLLWKYIQSQILTNDVLFIGYILEDSNIFSMIQEIHRNVKKNPRKYFFIAPGLKSHKIERLAKTKIIYYDSKAEGLFPVLFETLDKKIKSDYQRKRISHETFSRYSMLHGLYPIVKEGINQNEILKFDSEKQTDVKINVTGISRDIVKTIQDGDTYKYNSFLPNTHIPAMKLTIEMLSEINISINGLTVGETDDYQNLFISPTVEEINTFIRIPSRNFKERVKLLKYNANKEQVCLLLETEVYTLKLIFSFLPNRVLNCTCNINAKNTVKDIQQAIKWMTLIIALWNKEEVIIKKYAQMPLKFPINNVKELNHFKYAKKYFENIRDIEELYDVEFENVNTYSEDLYQMSELLIHSFHEHILREKLKGQECTIEVGDDQDGKWNLLQVGSDNYSFALTQNALETVEFNGQKFELKNKNTIIPSCIILDITKEKGKVTQIKFRITSEFVFVKYTNHDLTKFQEFSNFKRMS